MKPSHLPGREGSLEKFGLTVTQHLLLLAFLLSLVLKKNKKQNPKQSFDTTVVTSSAAQLI